MFTKPFFIIFLFTVDELRFNIIREKSSSMLIVLSPPYLKCKMDTSESLFSTTISSIALSRNDNFPFIKNPFGIAKFPSEYTTR